MSATPRTDALEKRMPPEAMHAQEDISALLDHARKLEAARSALIAALEAIQTRAGALGNYELHSMARAALASVQCGDDTDDDSHLTRAERAEIDMARLNARSKT